MNDNLSKENEGPLKNTFPPKEDNVTKGRGARDNIVHAKNCYWVQYCYNLNFKERRDKNGAGRVFRKRSLMALYPAKETSCE